jgi:hypothetical protein
MKNIALLLTLTTIGCTSQVKLNDLPLEDAPLNYTLETVVDGIQFLEWPTFARRFF